MTPRTKTRMRCGALAAAILGTSLLTGCDPRQAIYFLQPFSPTIPAPGPSLKGKKVVVLTHATSSTQAEFPGVDRDLARQFVNNIRKVKKINLVEPEKAATWMDAHPKWTDPSDAARDFEADIVIFLEIEEFRTQAPGDLNVLQGTSKVHIQAFELSHPKNSKGKEITDQPKQSIQIYDDYQETIFPLRGPIPMDSGVGHSAFKSRLLQVVATECSWHFVAHPQEDIVQDVSFNQRR